MPSLEHEAPLLLVQTRPAFSVTLLQRLGVATPSFGHAEVAPSDLTQILPVELRADAVVKLKGPDGERPVLGVVVEVQRSRDARKKRSWPLYAVALAAQLDCPTCVLVIALAPDVAAWAAEPIEVGPGISVRPHVIGPQDVPVVIEPAQILADPELAVLSAILHGRHHPAAAAMARTIIETLSGKGDEPDEPYLLYCDVVWNHVTDAVRAALEDLMETLNLPLKSPIRRAIEAATQEGMAKGQAQGEAIGQAKGEAIGEAKGEAQSLLIVLQTRGLLVPEETRRRILSCADVAVLAKWIERAVSAATVDEIFGEEP